MKVELTEKEWDLIESIRNYHKAYPTGDHLERIVGQRLITALRPAAGFNA